MVKIDLPDLYTKKDVDSVYKFFSGPKKLS